MKNGEVCQVIEALHRNVWAVCRTPASQSRPEWARYLEDICVCGSVELFTHGRRVTEEQNSVEFQNRKNLLLWAMCPILRTKNSFLIFVHFYLGKASKKKRRIIAVCNETKRKFIFGTEMEDEEGERRIIVRMVSYLALGGA